MTSDQALALLISFIMVICLTIDSTLLVRDRNLHTKDDELWQKWITAQAVTLLILWGVWALFTITFIPWGAPAKDVAACETVSENNNENNNEME